VRQKDGSEKLRLVSRSGGAPDDLSGNQLTYCSSGKNKTQASCAVYIYDGNNLVQTAPAARKVPAKKIAGP
jgi:hypothetical protein